MALDFPTASSTTSKNEQAYAQQLLELRRQSINEQQQTASSSLDSLGDDFAVSDNAFTETARRFSAAASGGSPEALEEGIRLGLHLRERINHGRFDGFIVALCLALVKDSIDLASLGTFGFIINLFITPALLITVMFQGIWFKRLLIKKFLWQPIFAVVAESIPFVGAFPWYTFSVILIKMKSDKEVRKAQEALEKLEKTMTGLRRGA